MYALKFTVIAEFANKINLFLKLFFFLSFTHVYFILVVNTNSRVFRPRPNTSCARWLSWSNRLTHRNHSLLEGFSQVCIRVEWVNSIWPCRLWRTFWACSDKIVHANICPMWAWRQLWVEEKKCLYSFFFKAHTQKKKHLMFFLLLKLSSWKSSLNKK